MHQQSTTLNLENPIELRFATALSEVCGQPPSYFRRDHILAVDLDFDSLTEVELQIELEDEFQIEIHNTNNLRTVGDWLDYLEERRSELRSPSQFPII